MSSVLQCLLASPLISTTFNGLKWKRQINKDLVASYKKIIESREKGFISNYALQQFKFQVSKHNKRFKECNQEDAAEFLSTFISEISKHNLIFVLYLALFI